MEVYTLRSAQALQGTGFSPYVHPAKNRGGFSPEGLSTSNGPTTVAQNPAPSSANHAGAWIHGDLLGVIGLGERMGLPVSAFAAAPQTAVLDIQNMTCSICSITIRKALEKVPGVIGANVDYDHKTATVKYDGGRTNPSALVKATTNAGFPSTVHSGTQKP